MRKWVCLIAVVGMMMLSPVAALAWDSTGHMVVALIAYRDLNDAQKQEIATILKAHPHYQKMLLENKPADVSADEWAFLRAAAWPDMVRPARPGDRYKSPAITHYHHGPWHYSDIPYVLGDFKRPATSEPTESALTALPANMKILSDASAKPTDRAVALAWVEHLVGDIHQPLHAVSMYSEKFPHGDQGGNAEMIRTTQGDVKRLHAFWDDAVGTSEDYKVLEKLADEIEKMPDDQAKQIMAKDTTPQSWLQESHDAAVKDAYDDGKLQTASAQDWDQKKIQADEVPQLSEAYEKNAQAVAKERILLAGHRLADELKKALQE